MGHLILGKFAREHLHYSTLKHDGMSFLKLNHWLMPCDGSLRTKQFRTVEHMSFASLIPYQQTERVTG
jgi:hypothetical protein